MRTIESDVPYVPRKEWLRLSNKYPEKNGLFILRAYKAELARARFLREHGRDQIEETSTSAEDS